MINFSLSRNTFYDTELSYSDLPSDLIEITAEKHTELLNALNCGCIIFSDLTYSSPQPTAHHNWNGENWIDLRTEEEKLAYRRSQYPKLIRYQFKRCLLEKGYKSSDIEARIQTIEDEYTRELTLLGFREATNFVRTDSSVLKMQSVLGLSDEKVDELWEYALQL
ncbi:hypothetical protein [Acinetobacter faecalis]|uniref:hypothetical protein n=1 Tax=Acinetobacter faecalis TaxID=2665161 RepID=UPI002A91BC10|nr:hypothetical protein [Acinetobacter faecalis]MDY6531257.1 hypothetical protein [Acinetobacter faecalis]